MTGDTGVADRRVAGWGTAAWLTLSVLLLSALDGLALVFVPLALLLLTAGGRRWRWLAGGVLLGMVGLALTAGPLGGVSRGWALLVGGAFALITMARPAWSVLTRALTTVAAATATAGLWLGLSGRWASLDGQVREHLDRVAQMTFTAAREGAPESALLNELAEAAGQVAELQAMLFPALVALQTLAALGLAAWTVSSLSGHQHPAYVVRPWREFRFNDQLVWLLIGGLALVLAPLGDEMARVGYNATVFMTALYAIRGVGVVLFVSVGASRLLMFVLGALAALFLYPLVLGAAILIGLGDTWLDVRGRAMAASRP